MCSGPELQRISSIKSTSVGTVRNTRERPQKSRPWERLSSNMFQFKGQQCLLLTDQYSRFPIIRRLTSTTSSAVINNLKSTFAEHGILLQLVTDNGPQYSSAKFDDFMTTYGEEHITSSPMYPQSNGSAE